MGWPSFSSFWCFSSCSHISFTSLLSRLPNSISQSSSAKTKSHSKALTNSSTSSSPSIGGSSTPLTSKSTQAWLSLDKTPFSLNIVPIQPTITNQCGKSYLAQSAWSYQ
jgi:hypothetical protein